MFKCFYEEKSSSDSKHLFKTFLGELDYDERKNINKRKKLIQKGIDPDEYEKSKKKAWKLKKRMQEKERRKSKNKLKTGGK